jgi:hypothetical protein
MNPRNRLVKLIEHWIEHNASHAARYRDVATEAEADGRHEVATQLRRAAELGAHVSTALRASDDS